MEEGNRPFNGNCISRNARSKSFIFSPPFQIKTIGACDALVHAAGFMRTVPLGELSADDGAAMWRIHVDSAAFLANALLPKMSADGRIVLIGSRTANGAPRIGRTNAMIRVGTPSGVR
jgi:NAD(P)-dependent dehydrogenase (short-subunit alcohol dehydrogenase family)